MSPSQLLLKVDSCCNVPKYCFKLKTIDLIKKHYRKLWNFGLQIFENVVLNWSSKNILWKRVRYREDWERERFGWIFDSGSLQNIISLIKRVFSFHILLKLKKKKNYLNKTARFVFSYHTWSFFNACQFNDVSSGFN